MSSVEKDLSTTPKELIAAVKEAAGKQDWDAVDKLAPLAAGMSGDTLVSLALEATWDKNDDVRDAAMTLWSFANPTPFGRNIHFVRAYSVMLRDPHESAAIWAAVTVARYLDSNDLGSMAKTGLAEFKERIEQMDKEENGADWQKTRDFVIEKVGDRVPNLANLI